MKAEELMINDWVLLGGTHPIRVSKLSRYGEYNNIEPVPLTAEILEKNGFEEKAESNPFVYYLFKDDDNSVSLEHTYDTTDKEDYWACCIGNRLCDVCSISMHYVHQLQHALKLCGIDKEIVL